MPPPANAQPLAAPPEPSDGDRIAPLRDPRTGARDERLTMPGAVRLAAMAADLRAGHRAWRAKDPAARGAALVALAEAIARHRAAIIAALARDTGRLRISSVEVDSVVGALRGWAASAAAVVTEPDWIPGRADPAIRHRGADVPYGLVGVISPWNFPLLLAMIDTIPALLAGCAVLVKPSEVTPRFAAPLMTAIAEVPDLAAVLRVVPGDGATGRALIDQVDAVAFTGSVATGIKVSVQAAARLIPAFLELGGKDPLIVLEGADLDAATDAALRGSVQATGQACQSIERIYVARPILNAFLDHLVPKARAVRFNWPDIGRGDIGPIIHAPQAEILARHVADAHARGARIVTGGVIETHGGGLWMAPTILTDVDHDMLVMREESFGPILPIMAFDSVDEAVDLANFGDFGLSAAVFGPDLAAAEAVGRRLEAGAISLNDAALTAQFHEAPKQSFKQSGLGPSRMGADALARFSRRRALIAQTGAPRRLSDHREDP